MPLTPLFARPTYERIKKRGTFDMKDLLASLLSWDTYKRDDDFDGDTLDATYQSTASGANSVAAAISTGVVNGAILLDPGDANSGRSDLSLGLHMAGQNWPVCGFRFQAPNPITNSKFEFGLSDTISGTYAGVVNAKATPTWTATTAVVVVYDTSDDTNLTLCGVAGGVASTAYDFTTQLVAGTWYTVILEVRDTLARAYLLDANGRTIEQQPSGNGWMTGATVAATLMTPWAFCQNRSAARHSILIDRLLAYQWRTTAH